MTKSTTKTPRPKPTKRDQLINRLGQSKPSSLAQLSKTLGWQPHTTRAAISGLRKAGYEIETAKGAKGQRSTYRLLGDPSDDPAAASSQSAASTKSSAPKTTDAAGMAAAAAAGATV